MFRKDIKNFISEALRAIQEKSHAADFAVPDFFVSVSENPARGDYAANAALVAARLLKKNPMEIAAKIATVLKERHAGFFSGVEIAPPGFINVRIADAIREQAFRKILEKRERYGDMEADGRRIQIEFISANPTGPLTLANGRGGFFGDVLSNVLASQGFSVEREYYVNDAGNQVRTLGLAILASLGLAPDSAEYYRGEYISAWAESNRELAERNKKDPEHIGRAAAEDFLASMIKPSIGEKMRIRFDRWTSEYADIRQKGYVEKAIALFEAKNLLYETDGAKWLKTTEFGDDKDRVLVTADGLPTYFLADTGHYLETKERGFDKINILGADHHGYVSRIQAVARIVGIEHSDIIVMQLVRLVENGKEIRMSKRKGVFVTIDELIDEVGLDAVRYFFLEKNPETHIDFNMKLAKTRSKENPIFYSQYAHARMASLGRKGLAVPEWFDFSALASPEERALVSLLLRFPEILEDIATDFRVSRLVRYVYDLAHTFHLFYARHRIIDAGEPERSARMALASAAGIVLKKSFLLLGITAPEEM